MQGAIENMIRSTESLLFMTCNLRMSLVTNDFEALIQELNQRKLVLNRQDIRFKKFLDEFQQDFSEIRKELEDVYYE